MSLTSIDTLIDYVVRNNIPAKDIHKIGKAKLKKIRLKEFVDHATEAKRKKATEDAEGQKIAAATSDASEDLEVPEDGPEDNTDQVPEHYIPPPDYVRRVYPDNSMMGIYERYYSTSEKYLDEIKSIKRRYGSEVNPVMTKEVFDTFFYNYEKNGSTGDLEGSLAYCFKIHGVSGIDTKNMRKAYFVTNKQRGAYPVEGSDELRFVLAGTIQDIDVYFITDKNHKIKRFESTLENPDYLDTIVTNQTWEARRLKKFNKKDLTNDEWTIWTRSKISDFFKIDKPKNPVPVPYLGDAGYIDTVEEEVVENMDNEIENPEDDVKGGWIWMFM